MAVADKIYLIVWLWFTILIALNVVELLRLCFNLNAEARAAIGRKAGEVYSKKADDEDSWLEVMSEYFEKMCDDISRERKRVGGDWVVAHVAFNETIRNIIRFGLRQ